MAYLNGGIPIAGQFNLKSSVPIDGRFIIDSVEELTAMVNDGALYPGLQFYLTKAITYKSKNYTVGQYLFTTADTPIQLYDESGNFVGNVTDLTNELNALAKRVTENETSIKNIEAEIDGIQSESGSLVWQEFD